MNNQSISRIRVGRRAARRLGFGNIVCRGSVRGRRFLLPFRTCSACACRSGARCSSPFCRWFLPFCLAALCWAASSVLCSRVGFFVFSLLLLAFAFSSLLWVPALGFSCACFLPCMSLGSRVGPFFGRAFCAFRVFSAPVSARLVGRRGVVQLFPSAFGSGLGFSAGCTFPVFLVLPSGVLVPAASLLLGSSFLSPVCAGRLCRPSFLNLKAITSSLGAIPAQRKETAFSHGVIMKNFFFSYFHNRYGNSQINIKCLQGKLLFLFSCMSILKDFQQQRGIPLPTGRPTVQYVPYSFGFMKQLHVIPATVDLTNPMQTFVTVFIPANNWGNYKMMYLKLGYLITLNEIAGYGTPLIQQFYNIQGSGNTFAGSCTIDSPQASVGRGAMEFKYIRIGSDIFDFGSYELANPQYMGQAVGQNRYLQVNSNASSLDFSTDINFEQIINVQNPSPGDVLQIEWAQASIQSPLDLGRLPR